MDPVCRALANAPREDEEISAEEEHAVAEAREWLKHNKGIPFGQAVADLGFTMEQIRSVTAEGKSSTGDSGGIPR
jgi:hypothetical protein